MSALPQTGDRIKGVKRDGSPYSGVVDYIHPFALHDRDRYGIGGEDLVIWLTNGQTVCPAGGDTWEPVGPLRLEDSGVRENNADALGASLP